MDVAECDEINIVDNGSDHKDEMIKRLSSKNSNKATGYLTPKLG